MCAKFCQEVPYKISRRLSNCRKRQLLPEFAAQTPRLYSCLDNQPEFEQLPQAAIASGVLRKAQNSKLKST
jgi:hypothetical protein